MSTPLRNDSHLASGDLLDGLAESPDLGVLEQGPHVAHPFVFAMPDQVALRRRERAIQEHDEGVRACPERAGSFRATTELILVDTDHRVGDLQEQTGAGLRLSELLHFGGHAPTFLLLGEIALKSRSYRRERYTERSAARFAAGGDWAWRAEIACLSTRETCICEIPRRAPISRCTMSS